jgi:glycogen debranching enzyme
MARYQGTKIDHWRDEEPGKIMHELRVGEMAHLNEIPQTPYYGTVDATPLFLVLSHAMLHGPEN